MAPPTGPAATTTRTTRSSTGAARGGASGRGGGPARGGGATRGGGIRKRGAGGPARIDRDGDLTMGQVSTTNGDTRKNTASSRGRQAPTRGSRSKANTSTDHKLRQFLGAVDPQLASRISEQPRKFREFHHKKVLKITGLVESKAATNDDHGEKATVEFLERKATKMTGRTVKISRVSIDIRIINGFGKASAYSKVPMLALCQATCKREKTSHATWKRSNPSRLKVPPRSLALLT